jgi:hypothetical protein
VGQRIFLLKVLINYYSMDRSLYPIAGNNAGEKELNKLINPLNEINNAVNAGLR